MKTLIITFVLTMAMPTFSMGNMMSNTEAISLETTIFPRPKKHQKHRFFSKLHTKRWGFTSLILLLVGTVLGAYSLGTLAVVCYGVSVALAIIGLFRDEDITYAVSSLFFYLLVAGFVYFIHRLFQ